MKLALLFPGQGSQKVGMGRELYEQLDIARTLFDSAAGLLGFDLGRLCFEGPDEQLRETINAQPALYVTSCAALESLRQRVRVEPFAAAGHSVGEYAALYAAGAMSFETGLMLVRRRAELMQEAAERRPGGMAAVIGLDPESLRRACEEARTAGIASIANYNAPGQIVISGEPAALLKAAERAKEMGAKRVIPLAVSGAFHSPLMAGAGDALYPALRQAKLKDTRFPVVMNVEADYCRNGVDFAPYLTMQISGSVRWEESMRRLLDDGVDTFLELGAGEVLAGLLKRIDSAARIISVQDAESLERAAELISSRGEVSGNEV